MTPAEHIQRAEDLLSTATHPDTDEFAEWGRGIVAEAIAHALIAVAVELGAPHPATPAGGEPGAQAAPPG